MRSFALVLTLITLCQPVFATPTNPAPKALSHNIETLRITMKVPGASIAVIEHGKIAWAQGFGYADLETKRPVTATTLFQAASITKTLTAATTLKLLNEKQIALDEPVNRYLKNWKIPENQYTQKVPVTFRMLLNHTAAISNPYPQGGYGPDDKLPTLQQTFRGESPATNPPLTVTRIPGTKYEYCNGCYAILQGALEAIANQPYPQLLQTTVLQAAAMQNSLFDNNVFKTAPLKIALPYDPQQQRYKNAPSRHPIYSTGGLWTNAIDLAGYAITLSHALKKDNQLITRDLAWMLITPSVTPIHGLGFFIGDRAADEKPDGHYIFHAGANIGYLTLLIISKDGQQGAVLMINISPEWDAADYPQFTFIKKSLKMIAEYYQWQD